MTLSAEEYAKRSIAIMSMDTEHIVEEVNASSPSFMIMATKIGMNAISGGEFTMTPDEVQQVGLYLTTVSRFMQCLQRAIEDDDV